MSKQKALQAALKAAAERSKPSVADKLLAKELRKVLQDGKL